MVSRRDLARVRVEKNRVGVVKQGKYLVLRWMCPVTERVRQQSAETDDRREAEQKARDLETVLFPIFDSGAYAIRVVSMLAHLDSRQRRRVLRLACKIAEVA